MSETPALPTPDEQTSQVLESTNRLYESGDVTQHFERWSKEGVSALPRYERPQETFDLENDDRIDTNLWTAKDEYVVPGQAIKPAVEARRPLTRSQELEMSLYYLDKDAQLKDIANVSHAVVKLRNLSKKDLTLVA